MIVTKDQLKTEFVRMRAGMAMALYIAVASVFSLSLVSGGMVYATSDKDTRNSSASSKHEKQDSDKQDSQPRMKDWVCKYTRTPGGDEQLKRGNDGLVWVDTHATEGTWFSDAHTKSYVVLANAPHSPRPDASNCPGTEEPEDGKVTAIAPTVVIVCGANNDKVSLPSIAHVTYQQTGWNDGKNVVTATAADDYRFEGTHDKTKSWTLTDSNTSCGQVLGTTDTPGKGGVTPTPQALADTGAPVSTVSLLSTLLLVATAAVIAFDVRRTRRQQAFEAIAL